MAVLSRRRFLATGSAATAALAAGCAHPGPGGSRNQLASAPDLSLSSPRCLPPVNVSEDRVIRTLTGLRPFRPSGFVVRAEKIEDTLVIHNYGHGGGGITLSWGTAYLAVELARGQRGPAAVLGCGAVGLATTMLLREAGYDVTIYAARLPPYTTSNVAGGQWSPVSVYDHDRETPEFRQQFEAAAAFAYTRYQTMLGPKFNVRWMRNYLLSDEAFNEMSVTKGRQGALARMMPELRDLTGQENPFPQFRYVRQFDSMLVDTPLYLAAVLDEARIAGVRVVPGEIHDRAAVMALPEKLVFNCTGLGAKALFGDDEMVPVKGQISFLLPQPEVQYATVPGGDYMFPRADGILLGGVHDRGNSSLEIDEAQKARMLAVHKSVSAGMRRCV